MNKKRIICFFICVILFTTILPLHSIKANNTSSGKDINITIGAGMLRLSLAGLSIARPIGIGTNIRVVNNGMDSHNGSWELVYTSLSGDFIKNQKGTFAISPDDPTPFHKGVIIYTTLINKISHLTMTVKVGNNTVSRSGIRFGPIVILGKYNK